MSYTALVTGADHGIGLELVRKLLEEGHRVFAGRFNSADHGLPELVLAYGEQLILVDLDVGSDASVQAAAAKVREHTDSLDLLINNAAVLGDIETTVLGALNFEEMLQVFNVNALGSLRVTNALIGLILNSKARTIANISSEAGSIGQCYRDSWFAYTMSKAAVNMHSNVVHNGVKAQYEAKNRHMLGLVSEQHKYNLLCRLPQLEAFSALCKELGESEANVALAWTLVHPAMTAPIIGPRTLEQFQDTLRVVDIKLEEAVLKRLDEIFPGPGGSAPQAYAW
ncbi:SDR family NAD(P)-dependent oxidoreductase [uncultured Paenibacillus sp.]|uniref:SDR family NAD(P)-dependent oxidoreductase n=1 Tax=uncultured Paenibacillus sp. TaxID=227322 RepID=UPI0028045B82|nr:SDR family NAD(P)-dependent oxidoreductase [uncultured Paenibacillus sp.]